MKKKSNVCRSLYYYQLYDCVFKALVLVIYCFCYEYFFLLIFRFVFNYYKWTTESRQSKTNEAHSQCLSSSQNGQVLYNAVQVCVCYTFYNVFFLCSVLHAAVRSMVLFFISFCDYTFFFRLNWCYLCNR